MMIDLRYKGRMDQGTSGEFNRIALGARKDFNDLVGKISKIHPGNIDWSLSSPLSRNIYVSPLFHYCCCIIWVLEQEKRPKAEATVLTDSAGFAQLMNAYCQQKHNGITIVYKLSVWERLKKIFRPWYRLVAEFLKNLLIFIVCRRASPKRRISPNAPLTLIDTFIFPNASGSDRYYPGLLEGVSEKQRQTIYFVPTWHGISLRQIPSLRQVIGQSRQILLKEQFLKLSDYFYAGGHFFHLKDLSENVQGVIFKTFDVSSLIREELKAMPALPEEMGALLNYRFALRLKESGVPLRLVIDWFENQIVDKGWNAGFRQYYPKTKIKGYQGFYVTQHYMCVYPTTAEMESFVIPHEVFVIGKEAQETARQYCPQLSIGVAPAFRFQHLWNERSVSQSNRKYTALVALPMILPEAVMILKILTESAEVLGSEIRFVIKLHPTTSLLKLKSLLQQKIPENFNFVNESLQECLEKADLLISTVSTAGLESLAKGIPVVVIGSQSGLEHNPIPPAIQSDIYRLCYTSQELGEAIRFYKNRSPEVILEHKRQGKTIREGYFEPVTAQGIREFLDLGINDL